MSLFLLLESRMRDQTRAQGIAGHAGLAQHSQTDPVASLCDDFRFRTQPEGGKSSPRCASCGSTGFQHGRLTALLVEAVTLVGSVDNVQEKLHRMTGSK